MAKPRGVRIAEEVATLPTGVSEPLDSLTVQ